MDISCDADFIVFSALCSFNWLSVRFCEDPGFNEPPWMAQFFIMSLATASLGNKADA